MARCSIIVLHSADYLLSVIHMTCLYIDVTPNSMGSRLPSHSRCRSQTSQADGKV